MQFLVDKAGLDNWHYRGDLKDNKRDGYGIQLFPNGAKFIGNWKKDKACGFGWLEFINGTYYEGNYRENII